VIEWAVCTVRDEFRGLGEGWAGKYLGALFDRARDRLRTYMALRTTKKENDAKREFV